MIPTIPARCLSFTKAAAELNVAASAISQRVRRLETLLGHPLFERLVNGLAITEEVVAEIRTSC